MMPAFLDLRSPAALNKTQTMDHFYADLKAGGLAQYTLLQPTMATSKTQVSNCKFGGGGVIQRAP